MDRLTVGFCVLAVVLLIGSSVVPPVVGQPVDDRDMHSLTCTVYGDAVEGCTLLVSRDEYVCLCDAFAALEMNMTVGRSLTQLFPQYQQLLLCLREYGLMSEQSCEVLLGRYSECIAWAESPIIKRSVETYMGNGSEYNLLGLVVGNTNNTHFLSRIQEVVLAGTLSFLNFAMWYVDMVLVLLGNRMTAWLGLVMAVLGFAFFGVWGAFETLFQGFFTILFHDLVRYHDEEQRVMLWNSVVLGNLGRVNPDYKEYVNGTVTTVGVLGYRVWSGDFAGMIRGFSGVVVHGDHEDEYRYCGVFGGAFKTE